MKPNFDGLILTVSNIRFTKECGVFEIKAYPQHSAPQYADNLHKALVERLDKDATFFSKYTPTRIHSFDYVTLPDGKTDMYYRDQINWSFKPYTD